MKAKFNIGDRIRIKDSSRLSGSTGRVAEISEPDSVVPNEFYYNIKLDETVRLDSGTSLDAVGRGESEVELENPIVDDPRLAKIVLILEYSDIVWTKWGSDTIEGLARKILTALD